MKKTHLSRRLICLFLAIVLVVSVFAGLTLTVFAVSYTYNWGQRNTVCTSLSTAAQNYYTGDNTYAKLIALNANKTIESGNSLTAAQNNPLYDALYELMRDTQTFLSSYGSGSTGLQKLYEYSDTQNSVSNGTYMLFWAGYTRAWEGNYVNQEHVWCKSRATYVESDGGSDLHHLRPASRYINQGPHNNRPYGTVSHTSSTECYDSTAYSDWGNYSSSTAESFGGWYDTTTFEPRDDIKGDTARILLYVYVRWHQPNLYTDLTSAQCGNFVATMSNERIASTNVTKVNGTDNADKTIESLSTLLSWCANDPVDTWEMGRNDAIQSIEGNRNVFIDYPELAWYLFGKQSEMPSMTTPSGNANNGSVTPSNYTITATSNNEAYGTVSLNGNVITATPTDDTLYYAATYNVTSGTASVSQSGNNFTVNASSDCTVMIVFAPIQYYTVNYIANNASAGSSGSVAGGSTINLPDTVTTPTVDGWTFAGWTDSANYEESSNEPVNFYAPDAEYTVTADAAKTLYAVYTKTEGGTGSATVFKLVDSFTGGKEYIFASSNTSGSAWAIDFDGVVNSTTNNQKAQGKAVTITKDGSLTYIDDDTASLVWTVSGTSPYTAKNGNYYLSINGSGLGRRTASQSFYLDSTCGIHSTNSSGKNYYVQVKDAAAGTMGTSSADSGSSTNRMYLFEKTTIVTGTTTYTINPSGQAHEHDLSPTAAVSATCDTAGNTAYYTCSGCGRYFSDAEGNNEIAADSWVIPASGHNWDAGVVTTEADCGHAGVMTYTCQNDATHTKTENIPATGEHSYVATVTAPTASTEGYTTYTCSVCGNSYTGSYKYLLTFRTPAGVPSISSQIVDAEDADITLPTADAPTGYTFEGWVTQDYENVSDKPETVLSGSYTVQNSAALIALYSKSESGGTSTTPASLTQLSTTDTINDGDKIVIRAYNTDYALYQETSGTSYVKNWSFENNAATVAADDKNWVTFTKNGDTWYIGDDTNNYLYAKSGSSSAANTLVIGTTKTDWTLETNENGFRLKGNGRYLSCRTDLTTGNANLWRLGGTSTSEGSNNGTKTLLLYRYTPASTGSSTVTTYTTVFGIELHGVNLTLNGNINTNAYLVIPTAERDGLKAIVTTTNKDGGTVYLDKDGKVTTVQTGYAVTEALSGGLFKFVAEMPAKDMNTKVHIELKDSNNQTVSFRNSSGETVDHYDYCVQDYLQQVITHPDVYSEANYPGLLALCKAMSDYGYAAQMQFVYNTDQHPSTESGGWYNKASIDEVGIDAVAGYSGYEMSNTDESLKYYGASLILESETTIRLYFTYSGTGTLTATVDGVEGKSLTHYADGSKYWFVDIKNIAAKDLDVKHSVTVSDGANTAGVTNYAAYSYVWKVLDNAANRSENMVRLVQALYFYGSKAETYFK